MITKTLVFCTALVLAAGLTAGCDRNNSKPTQKVATQVAARVDDDEITVHQLDYAVARSPNVTPENASAAKHQILEKLISQQLAIQQAVKIGLDRSPGVIQAMEVAKREILARAYLNHLVSGLDKPQPWEIREYYRNHPELFAQRRIFTLDEFAFVANAEVAADLTKLLPKSHSMKVIADWLKSHEIKFAAKRGVRAAEQIPLNLLPKLQSMKEGEIQLFDTGGKSFQVIRVMAILKAPMGEAAATPRIEQFFVNRRSRKVIADAMERIRKEAKIEYVGEFAGKVAVTAPKVKREPNAKAETEPEAKPDEFRYSWEATTGHKPEEPLK